MRRLSSLLAAALLAGCSLAPTVPAPVVYALAPAADAPAPASAPAAVQVSAPPWLDGHGIVYRLDWRDATQLASYRDSRWAAPPAALLGERLRQRAARAAAAAPQLLRVELEDFCHAFATPERSRAVVRLRAALIDPASGRVLRQRAFAVERDASTADAAGGAHALADAADAAAAQVLAWAAAPS